MSRTLPDSHSEQEPSRTTLQRRIAAMWADTEEVSDRVVQQLIAKVLSDPEQTERNQQALEAQLGVDRDTVISKWMAKPKLLSDSNGVPLGPLRAPTIISELTRSRDLSARSTSPMDTSEDSYNIATSPENSASPMNVSESPFDTTAPVKDDQVAEATHRNRIGARSNLYASKPSRLNQENKQQALLPPKKKQRQDQSKITTSTRAKASTLAPAPDTSSSSNVSMAQSSRIDAKSPLFVEQVDRYPVKDFPKWYTSITDKNIPMIKITKNRPSQLTSLESLKNCIGRCEDLSKQQSPRLRQTFDELRDHVHKAEIVLQVDKYIVRKARILHPENGLPRIFNEDANFPTDLKADSFQLYLRWYREDFNQDVLRGIITVKGPNRGSDKLDQAYKAKFLTSAKDYGHGDLVNGQCWPSQLCLVRDGAHGSSQGGIFGDKEKGTYSIVLSGGGGYHDEDHGDSIWYSGTDGKDFKPTEATQQMILSASIGNFIRVIRSCNLKAKNKYRPEVGFRYDGLYQIKAYELVDKEKQIHRFNLHRCPGQEEIRWGDDAMSRPTKFEIAAYKDLKTKYRWA